MAHGIGAVVAVFIVVATVYYVIWQRNKPR
jgi:hypothetical protein